MDRALTAMDVARILGLKKKYSAKTVEKLAREKKIKGIKIGGQWRFHPMAVDDMLMMASPRR